MRNTAFGDPIIESTADDLGSVLPEDCEGADGIHAIIREDDDVPGKFNFAILTNEDGEEIATSESIFDTADDARSYLKDWITDIQTN